MNKTISFETPTTFVCNGCQFFCKTRGRDTTYSCSAYNSKLQEYYIIQDKTDYLEYKLIRCDACLQGEDASILNSLEQYRKERDSNAYLAYIDDKGEKQTHRRPDTPLTKEQRIELLQQKISELEQNIIAANKKK